MMTWSQLPPLTAEQRSILSEFVSCVLPAEGSRNWTRNNELEYVHSIVNRWMKKNHGFHISPADLFARFEAAGHLIKRISMDECPPELCSDRDHKAFSPYVEHNAWKLHVNVNVLTLHLLAESNRPLPPNAPAVKRASQTRLVERLGTLALRLGIEKAA